MADIVLSGSTSGSVTLSAQAVSGSTTLTLPTTSGTVVVAGPAFSARNTSTQAITNNTFTKILFDTEDYDTNNNFASSRFTPTVAGYYLLNAVVGSTGSASVQQMYMMLYKNGSILAPAFRNMNPSTAYSSNGACIVNNSMVVSLNGSGDYIELYVYVYNDNITIGTGNNGALLSGTYLRSAA